MRHRLCLIICYFGEFPWYFRFFVHSCGYNPTVDFYIVTDNTTPPADLPPNVKWVVHTLAEFRERATRKLGFGVPIHQPYKICDFKPAFAFFFPEIVYGYDYWGYGDIDVIFGDIRAFMDDLLLGFYDVISVRDDYLTGFFTLYRNCSEMNTLFMKSRDYRKVFESDMHYCFDETNFHHEDFSSGKPYDQIDSDIMSMTHVVKKCENEGYLKAYFDFHVVEACPGSLEWMHGKLIYKKQYECMLYHLIWFKKIFAPFSELDVIPDHFFISTDKIYYMRGLEKIVF